VTNPTVKLPGSMWTRKMIIHESWAKAQGAGPFGYGLRPDLTDEDDR
jgi:hypothetical protein